MVYYVEDISSVNEETFGRFLRYIPADRIERVHLMRVHTSKIACTVAFLLLRYALYQEYGFTTMPLLRYEDKGKPFLSNYSDIYFNLSHSMKSVACGLSSQPIGVDIQYLSSFKPAVAERYMSNFDFSLLDPEEKKREFIRLWCEKESYVKYLGTGLESMCDDIPEVDGLIRKGIPLDTAHLSYVGREDLNFISVDPQQILDILPKLQPKLE